ncbi:flagellar biosynthesis protein FlhF [Neobacillus piezotolerans]|uniref:Flagellar biosynthesis protein FlhF n=1 Tax=Neobacillus piezotolerans TaxID=2259171 RepID=A0A3D8GN13_9BACI|nr:flagellar biosynthesis protein FlhF [Neobacillus piezotolerans]RDU35884.1 flagellar biosynthesis protein FlhF [Neobacillus piezotolerans]
MKIKTYIVNNLTEAYPLIFKDLGTSAFILNSKEIRSGGIFGWFGRKQVEVVAAADISKETPTAEEKPQHESQRMDFFMAADTAKTEIPPEKEVLREISEMKGLIHSMIKNAPEEKKAPGPLDKWVQHLEDQEVDREVIQYIVKKAEQTGKKASEEEMGRLVFKIVTELLREGLATEPEKGATAGQPSLITLVGPTGVGKTTTIAKLAAARAFQKKQKVGLLTSDTFRIAAVEQLLTYADILNIPLEVVMKEDELETAMKAMKGRHVVFMDTAGRNYLEKQYINEVSQFLRYDTRQENYLVLSMTSRWRDMKNIVEQMKAVPIDKLILTKWDETACYGAALNMAYHYPYPLAFICTGQEVPQDIVPAEAEFMAKKLLGVEENAAGPGVSFKAIV